MRVHSQGVHASDREAHGAHGEREEGRQDGRREPEPPRLGEAALEAQAEGQEPHASPPPVVVAPSATPVSRSPPIIIPIVLAAVDASGKFLAGAPMAEIQPSLTLLIALDVIFTSIAFMVFDYVVEE